ncbi:hypothetical protein [Arthrobacter globiformis]|uniref:Uncharacterized protein n=1 Tax=Arthrobacter globiformis TaxID=1665 RepID=A0A328HB08_ARTGO|nr:hypothetical protein [Arthrobacter globiformis]RAM35679.1 hypothetical protein DBZ45_18790 [Arthrobacter globiformis]
MSKSSRNRNKRKGPAGTGSSAARGSSPASLSSFRAGRAVDSLAPAFVRWFDDGAPGAAATALECLAAIESVMGRYMDRVAAADLTRLDPAILAEALAADLAATAADDDRGEFVIAAVHGFVDFLAETDRWSGPAEQLADVTDLLNALLGETEEWRLVDVPVISDDDALQAFSELPLIQRTTALLQWIGDAKPVTGTGALRTKDIEAAAACVGLKARGGPKQQAGLPQAGNGGSERPVPTVRSMYEVPLLAQVWEALARTELIKIGSTKAAPSPATAVFLAGGTPDRLEELVFFVEQFLSASLLGYDPEQPWDVLVAATVASILLAAASADPPRRDTVLDPRTGASPEERATVEALKAAAMGQLEALAEQGILTIDTHFRVPPALVRCIASTYEDASVLEDLGLLDIPDLDVDSEDA